MPVEIQASATAEIFKMLSKKGPDAIITSKSKTHANMGTKQMKANVTVFSSESSGTGP